MRYFLLCIKLLSHCCGDIEIYPGSKQSSLTFCHWNLNCIGAHDFVKISLIQRHITEHNIDLIHLPETFLNSSLNNEDDRLKIEGYNFIRADHPSGLKRGVCVYYKVHIHPGLYPAILGGTGFSTSTARRKTIVQLGSLKGVL